MKKKQIIGGIVGLIVGIIIAVLQPPAGLEPVAMRGMGILICVLVWMIMEVMPEYIILLLFCSLTAITKSLTFEEAFASFSTANWWLLVGAIVIGAAVAHSGLLKRLALYVMKAFPGTYLGQLLGITISGVFISPLIPSGTARIAVAGPIAKEISEEMGLESQSKGATGIFAAVYTGFMCTSHVFLSASFMGYLMLNYMPEGYNDVSWMEWLIWALPWSIVAIGGTTILTYLFYKPKEKISLDKSFIIKRITDLGSWKRGEKITMAILTVSLLLWMTERQHGISAALVSILAVCGIMITRVMNASEFRSKVAWDILVYIGCIYQIGGALSTWGVTTWLGGILGPIIVPFIDRPVLFVIALALIIYLARTIIASWIAVMTIFSVLLVPISIEAGMHPFIPCFVAYCAVNIWLLKFQNVPYISVLGIVGDMVDHNKNCIPYALFFMLMSLIGFIVSVPFWGMLGML